MTIIRMDTEIVNNLAERLQSTMSILDRHMDSILKIGQSLDWEGLSRDEFLAALYEQNKNHQTTKENYENLVYMLKQEIFQWEQAGARFGDSYFTKISNYNNSGIASSVAIPLFGLAGNVILSFASMIQGKADLDEMFKYFNNSNKASGLLGDAVDENILFQFIDENGKIVEEFGAKNGTATIPVKWISAESLEYGILGGYSDPPPAIVLSDELKNSNRFDLQQTLAHEMQHAIDYQNGTSNRTIVNQPYGQLGDVLRNIPDEGIENYDWNHLEDQFSSSCMERLKTEVNSYSRGFEIDPRFEFDELNVNMDGNFTPSEMKYVLETRDYAKYYEQNIIETFKENGFDVNANIWWDDENNKVAVDISDVQLFNYAREVYNA